MRIITKQRDIEVEFLRRIYLHYGFEYTNEKKKEMDLVAFEEFLEVEFKRVEKAKQEMSELRSAAKTILAKFT